MYRISSELTSVPKPIEERVKEVFWNVSQGGDSELDPDTGSRSKKWQVEQYPTDSFSGGEDTLRGAF